MRKPLRSKSPAVEQMDLEHDPSRSGLTRLLDTGPSGHPETNQDQRVEIRRLWDQSVAAAARGEELEDIASVQTISLDFCHPAIGKDVDVHKQHYQSMRDTLDFLKLPVRSDLKTRLLILHPVLNISSRDIRETPYGKIEVQRQLRSLAAIVVELGYDSAINSAEKFICLSGWEVNPSGGPRILETLSPRRQLTAEKSSWSFQRFDTIALPHVQVSIEKSNPAYYKKSPKRATFKMCSKKGAAKAPDVTCIVMTCNDGVMVDRLCSRLSDGTSGSGTSGANDADVILDRMLAVLNERTADVLQQISNQLFETRYTVRHEPSWSIHNYILHVEDHLDILQESLRPHLLRATGTTSLPTPTGQTAGMPSTAPEKLDEVIQFSNAIAILKEETMQIRATNKDQLSSKDSTKNKLFAVLAAIYLPFSLASSILGMNVVGLNEGTDAKWPLFLVLGLPLAAFTVALPLTFGRVYRVVRNFSERNPVAFRRAVRLSSLFSVLIVIIVLVVVIVVELVKK